MKSTLVAALMLSASLLFSQGNTTVLSGTITDPTGAGVPASGSPSPKHGNEFNYRKNNLQVSEAIGQYRLCLPVVIKSP